MQYTKQSLNSRMADVMGWDYPDRWGNWYADGTPVAMSNMPWNPTEDANRALMVLEKWCEGYQEDGRMYDIHRHSGKGYSRIRLYNGVYGDRKDADVAHKSLPVAICLAIASAEDKERATLEDADNA